MKSILLIITILFVGDIYAQDYSCLFHVVDRHDGSFSESFPGVSTMGSRTACSVARVDCENYIKETKSTRQFCYEDNTSISIYDLRFKGAKAYYLGELREEFTALCYGNTKIEAGKYCREKVMNSCDRFVISKPEEDWYCSFY